MKHLFTSVIALLVTFAVAAQPGAQQIPVIPADKAVRVGQLPNGMKYYLRHNDKQKNLADFYISHDVGAIQEEDDQQGLAHFLEHMAFNGTKNLPGKMLIEYLETVGVKFGVNLNAGTSWDYTQYLLKDVPTIRPGIIDSALLILHDWSHFIALQPKEIDAERGVIMEELRMRDGASWRGTIQLLKAVGKGTRYEHRNLIGHLDGLKSFDHSSLENFYHKWYRPEYQAVVVVGDINVDEVETKLQKLMADIPASPADAPQKEVIVVPDNKEPIISIFEDPEMTQSSASLFIKRQALPKQLNNTVVAEQLALIDALASEMANARLQEIAMKPNAPFTGARFMNGGIGICSTLECAGVDVNTQDGKLLGGFEAAYTELERIRRHGFTESELERAKQSVMKEQELAYNNRNDRKNGQYVQRYLNAFRKNAAMPDAETEWKLDSMIISQLQLPMINQVVAQYITDHNQVLVVQAPKREGLTNPTEAQFAEVLAKVKAATIAPYADNTVKEPLIPADKKLKGSKVKKESKNEEFGTIEWTLKNGLKVVVKPTKFKADEVQVAMVAHSGQSSLSDELYWPSALLPTFVGRMGVSKFSATDLRKQLSGKNAQVYVSPDDYASQVVGVGSPKDLETIMQLLYLQFTDPRFSKEDYDVAMAQLKPYVENLQTNPDYISAVERQKTLYGNHFRRQQITPALLDKVKFEQLEPAYKALFSNAANFTTYIVGNVDVEALKPLVEKYLGSLPVSKKLAKKVDDGVRAVKGEVVNDFKVKMQQPKVGVTRIYTGPIDYTMKNRVTMNVLSQVLRSRYTISIREEKGGTYSVGVGGRVMAEYEPWYQLIVLFDTNEQMADELSQIVVKEIQTIANEGPNKEDVEKTRKYLLKEYENQIQQNGNWVDWLDQRDYRGVNYPAEYKKAVEELTYDDLKALAAKILKDNNMTYVVMRPEK
ncbi:MAG: insulinase family protein [Rikenellaceae bacterium]|nr:insulinase family protein [Rikenellaceae bacterium]